MSVYIIVKHAIEMGMMEECDPIFFQDDFEAWMTQEQRRIYVLCLRMLRNKDDADTTVQDVFVKAFRVLEKSKGQGIREPAKWLTRVTINACLDRLRSRRWMFWRQRISGKEEQTLLQLIPAAGRNQEEALIAGDLLRHVYQALDRLSARQRLVFLLKHDEGKSLEEIAEILHLDLGTVKSHMARAISKLRKELRDLYVR